MIRIRHHALQISALKVIEMLEWMLNNFDFERGYVTMNADEDVRMDRLMTAQHLGSARMVAARGDDRGNFTILRTLYFDDEHADQAMFYRMKFV